MEVRLPTIHGADHCHIKRRYIFTLLFLLNTACEDATIGCCDDWWHSEFAGTIMTISKDRVKPSPLPDSWKLAEIFTTGIVLGGYLAMMTVIFFWAAYDTDFFPVSTYI